MYCKSSIPGYYIMSDLNEDTGSSWPLFFDNKKPNGHLYSGCMLNYLSGYSEYDKEMLKRTMLEHEAIFKRQVYELHRLYRIQKNLMEDFQKNDLYRFSTWPIKSKATFSSSGVQSQDTRKMWQVSHQAAMSSSMSRETAAETDMNISPICFCESNLQSSIGQLENGAPERDGESNPRFRVHMKRMFDLRLPADGYIDCEGTEKSEKEDVAGSSSVTRVLYSNNCNADPENEVKLTLANVGSPNGREGVHKSNSLRKGSLFHGLADLNEPIKETSSEGTPYSVPARLLFQGTQPDDYQKHNTSNNLWLQRSFSRDRDCDERGSSNTLPVKEEINQVWSQFHCEAGQHSSNRSPDYGKEKCPISFEALQVKVNKADAKFLQKQSTSWKILGNSSHCAVSDNPENLASVLPNSSVAPQMDINATTSPPLPTWMKPSGGEKHSSVPLETASSFDRSAATNKFRRLDTTTGDSSTLYDTLHFSGNLRSNRCLETGPFCHQSGFNHVFHLDSQSKSQAKQSSFTNSNLNLREYSFGIQDHITAQENKVSGMDGDCKGYSSGLSWLKNQPSCSEFLDLKRFPSKMDLCFSTSGLVSETELEIRTIIPSCNLEASPSSTLRASEDKTKRNEVPDSSSDKYIFGLPIFDKIHPNPGSENQRQLQVASSQHDSLFCDFKPFNTKRDSSVEKSRSFKNNIDLNCEVPFIDESVFSKIYAKSQDAVPLQILDSSSVSKALPFIDLEAPVLSPEEDNVTQIESTPSKRECVQQDGCSRDMFFKEAAKNLMELSLDKFNQSDDKPSCLATTLPCSTLHWFADVVLSNTDGKISVQDGGVDLFELMTLQLDEMKPEELCCNPQVVETASDDAKSRAFLLLKKPRRGQARKRRQRRDFQKDTLPGLATLSRQEVNEDLQTIGGMMKASGCPWELGMGSRNAGRNGSKVHARGRRKPRNTSVIVTEVQLSPPQTLFLDNKNANNPEFEVDKPGMVGWGRTTRRCRRQRCPPPSITTALT